MSDERAEAVARLNDPGNPDRWYLDTLPVGAVSEDWNGDRYRKAADGRWYPESSIQR